MTSACSCDSAILARLSSMSLDFKSEAAASYYTSHAVHELYKCTRGCEKHGAILTRLDERGHIADLALAKERDEYENSMECCAICSCGPLEGKCSIIEEISVCSRPACQAVADAEKERWAANHKKRDERRQKRKAAASETKAISVATEKKKAVERKAADTESFVNVCLQGGNWMGFYYAPQSALEPFATSPFDLANPTWINTRGLVQFLMYKAARCTFADISASGNKRAIHVKV